MKIQEFVEIVENQNKNKMSETQMVNFLKKTLDIKEYISIKSKKQLAEDIISECIYFQDGIFKFDNVKRYIVFTMKSIEAYTNLELSDDIEDDYDALAHSKLLHNVIEVIGGEFEEIRILLQMRCDYILEDNRVESQIARFLDNLMNKLNLAHGMLEKFDPNKLPISSEDINKLMEFINK